MGFGGLSHFGIFLPFLCFFFGSQGVMAKNNVENVLLTIKIANLLEFL